MHVLCLSAALHYGQRLYIGCRTDLRRRLIEHKQGASFATKHRGPWKLIYYEAYIDQCDAQGRERYLKSSVGRRFLRQQLRHYLEKIPESLKTCEAAGHVSAGGAFTWLPRLDSNQE